MKAKCRYIKLLPAVFAAFVFLSCASMTGKHQDVPCRTCHTGIPGTGAPSLKKSDNFSEICRECHDYRRPADHHPDRPDSTAWLGIFGEKASMDEFFVLYDKKMECLSCHRLHKGRARLEGTENFLAGGPYEEKRDVCMQCHKNKEHADFNPHAGISDTAQHHKCLVCHIKVPQGKSHSRDNLALRAADAFLCLKCHPPMEGEFMKQHFLKNVYDWKDSADIDIGYRPIYEINPAGLGPGDDTILHLDPFGRITCFTCHNPHLPHLGHLETLPAGAERMDSGNICAICHKK